ncbi:hypothetical protein EVAR_10060_1 [Eumeta japonica]|uniref:Uncharacterized protein n=1 Tax=Eumeta variegata TaxID=151549 RepID=A0A4C1TR87_EUMVA|nr:hypothetical protein EVAR_10060_1 [Eumeta japonica]
MTPLSSRAFLFLTPGRRGSAAADVRRVPISRRFRAVPKPTPYFTGNVAPGPGTSEFVFANARFVPRNFQFLTSRIEIASMDQRLN